MSNNPSPGPTPVAGPTAVSDYVLPNIPANAYHLLSNLADAIDTANTKLKGHAAKLDDIITSTDNAVYEVTSTSKGQASDTLDNIWQDSKFDLSTAHHQLTAITTTPGGMGPGIKGDGWSIADLRTVLDDNKAAIQTGLIALENLQNQQSGRPSIHVTNEQLVQWKQEVDALDNAMNNVNMVIEGIAMAIRGTNNGFRAACKTGFVPSGTLPLFTKRAFAHQADDGSSDPNGNRGGSGGGEDLETRIENAITKAGGTDLQAIELIVDAEAKKIDLNVIADLLEKGIHADVIDQFIKTGGNITDLTADVTTLTGKGISSDAINVLLENGTSLKDAATDINTLSSQGITSDQINQLIQKNMGLKYTNILLNKGVSIDNILKYSDQYTAKPTAKTPGYSRWTNLPSETKDAIANTLNHWANGTQGFPNDGTRFDNDPPVMPRGTQPPYTEYTVSNTASKDNWRLVVDANGKVYFMDHYNFSGGAGKNAALPVPFSWIMQLFK